MVSSKLLIATSFLMFGLLIVMISAVRLAQPTMLATDFSQNIFTASTSAMPHAGNIDQLPENFFDTFPVPTILPDHPLYWSKMVSDRIQIMTASTKQQKIEYLLDCADRRLSSAAILIVNDKDNLGVTTLSKAEKYLLRSASQGDKITKDELKQHIVDHVQVLNYLLDVVPDEYKSSIENSKGTNQQALNMLE